MPEGQELHTYVVLTHAFPAGYSGTIVETTPISFNDPGMTNSNMQVYPQ